MWLKIFYDEPDLFVPRALPETEAEKILKQTMAQF